jgi:hypothetical protein
LDDVKALDPRFYFFDAPLATLNDTSANTTWDITLSPIASTDFAAVVGWSGLGEINDTQREAILTLVNDAHTRGIQARLAPLGFFARTAPTLSKWQVLGHPWLAYSRPECGLDRAAPRWQ